MKKTLNIILAIFLGLLGIGMLIASQSVLKTQLACGNDLIPADIPGGLVGLATSLPVLFVALLKARSAKKNQIVNKAWYNHLWLQLIVIFICIGAFGYVVVFRHLFDSWCF